MPCCSPISPKRTLGRRCRFGGGAGISAFSCAAVVSGAISGKDMIGGSGGGKCVSGDMTVRDVEVVRAG